MQDPLAFSVIPLSMLPITPLVDDGKMTVVLYPSLYSCSLQPLLCRGGIYFTTLPILTFVILFGYSTMAEAMLCHLIADLVPMLWHDNKPGIGCWSTKNEMDQWHASPVVHAKAPHR